MVNSVITTNNSNDKYKNILEYLLAIVTILQCNSIYIFQLNHDELIVHALFQLFLFLIFIYYLKYFTKLSGYALFRLYAFLFIFLMISISFYLFEFFYYPQFSKLFIIRMLLDPILIIIYFSCCWSNVKSFFYKLENIIIILGIISIPFWIMANMHISPTSAILTSKWYSSSNVVPIESYFHIGFIIRSYSNLFGLLLLRNSGIFTEASMYAYVLSIALCIELFLKDHTKFLNKKIIFLLFVIISTASTTNIVFSFLALFYRNLMSKKFKKYIMISLLMAPILFIFLEYIVSKKVNKSSSSLQDSSYSVRMDDIKAGMKAWYNHLLIGNGLGNNDAIQSYIASWRFSAGHAGISAGFTTVLAWGGIVLALFYVIPLIFSFVISPSFCGFAIFTSLPVIFVAVQDTYLCVLVLSYLWTVIIYLFQNPKHIKILNKS